MNRISRLWAVLGALTAAAPLLAGSAAAHGYYSYSYAGARHHRVAPSTTTVMTATREPGPAASVRAAASTPVHPVFLRAGPRTGAPILRTLRPGMPLHVLASANSGWMQVSTPEGTGWTYGSYLAPGVDEAAAPAADVPPAQITSP